MHVTRHQFVMALRRAEISPVVGEFENGAESAGAFQQAFDMRDGVIRRADAGIAALGQEFEAIGDVARNDREGRDVAEIIAEVIEAELHIFARLFAGFGDMEQRDEPPFLAVRLMVVEASLLAVKAPVLGVMHHGVVAGAADRQHADAVPSGGERSGRRARRGDRHFHHRLRVARQLQFGIFQRVPIGLLGDGLAFQQASR